ncbi:MAG: hypothetical protein ACOCWG_04570 [bacterium]
MEKFCLDCGEKLLGRADKKFCNDVCRNNYNNKFHRVTTAYIKKVNKVLRRNRLILAGYNPDGKTKIHKKKLVNQGFNFNYFTNIYKTKTGNIYYFCYEHGYLPLENDFFALVKREEYLV